MVRGSTIDVVKAQKSSADIDLAIHNRFDIEVKSADTGKVKQRAEAYNLIKDDLWSYLFSSNDYKRWFTAIIFGNGSGTPTADTSGLFSYAGGKNASGDTFKTVPEEGYAYYRRSIQLGVSEYNGTTITEVGISSMSVYQANRVFTHAMLQDMNGNPISITKTDTDIITIYATVYVHWNPAGYEDGKIKVLFNAENGVNGGGVMAELLGCGGDPSSHNTMYFYSGPPGMATGSVSGGLVKDLSTKSYRFTFGRLGVDAGNTTAGILYAAAANMCIKAPCSGLPGTTITAEAIGTGNGTRTEWNTKFPFPQDAEIFVDGVLTTDVIVDNENPGAIVAYTTAFEFLPEYSTCSFKGDCGMVPMGSFNGDLTWSLSGNGYMTFINKWAHLGVSRIYRTYAATILLSDDLENWYTVQLVNKSGVCTANVPIEYAYCKYWRITGARTNGNSGYNYSYNMCLNVDMILASNTYNIRFTTPPAEGSVITANYYTPLVAKDTDHVFDISMTIHVGEYTE